MAWGLQLWMAGAILAFTCAVGTAETFRVGAGGEESPYPVFMESVDGRTFSGIAYDLLKEIARRTGDRLVFVVLPSARVVRGISDGTIDIDAFAAPQWRLPYAKDSLYTVPYLWTQDYFIFHRGHRFAIHKLSDLKNKTVETMLGFGYEGLDRAFASNSVHRSDSRTVPLLLKMVENDRADVGILNGVVFDYYRRRLGLTDLVEGGPFGPAIPVSFRFSPKHALAVRRFDRAIRDIQRDGTWERILARYDLRDD